MSLSIGEQILGKGLSWMAVGRRRTILMAAGWLLGGPALAHSWYPTWCCDDHDCRELIEARGETVTETAEGWRLWDGRLVERDYAKMSPDTKFHICEEPTTRAIICFFAPQGSS